MSRGALPPTTPPTRGYIGRCTAESQRKQLRGSPQPSYPIRGTEGRPGTAGRRDTQLSGCHTCLCLAEKGLSKEPWK